MLIFTLQESQKEKREKGAENTFEDIITESFPKPWKGNRLPGPGAHKIPDRMDPKRNTPKYGVIKVAKIKDREY